MIRVTFTCQGCKSSLPTLHGEFPIKLVLDSPPCSEEENPLTTVLIEEVDDDAEQEAE